MSAALKTKRQQLGELIVFLRTEQSMTRHNLADKTRATTKEVERWERGDLVPSTQEWQRMRGVFAKLMSSGTSYYDLYKAAASEQLGLEQAKDIDPVVAPSCASDLDAAVRILVDAVPSLRSMTIEIDDEGTISVNYKTREVRIVEDDGHLRVRR